MEHIAVIDVGIRVEGNVSGSWGWHLFVEADRPEAADLWRRNGRVASTRRGLRKARKRSGPRRPPISLTTMSALCALA
jgi:hypothetical protein